MGSLSTSVCQATKNGSELSESRLLLLRRGGGGGRRQCRRPVNSTTGLGFCSIRDHNRFKRNSNPTTTTRRSPVNNTAKNRTDKTTPDRRRSHHHSCPALSARKFPLFPFRGRSLFYFCVLLAVFLFALASMVLQSSFVSVVFRMGGGSERRERLVREGLKFGSPRRRLARGGGVLPMSWIGCGGVGLELLSGCPY